MRRLPCKHVICAGCLKSIRRSKLMQLCPLCRGPLVENDLADFQAAVATPLPAADDHTGLHYLREWYERFYTIFFVWAWDLY